VKFAKYPWCYFYFATTSKHFLENLNRKKVITRRDIMEYALITGASSGIGFELANIMAEKGHNLILVARREAALHDLKNHLEKSYKVAVEIAVMDLSETGQAQALYQHCINHQFTVKYLVNNAGYGDYGKFDLSKLEIYQNMLQLNIVTLTELTALFLDEMKKRKSGHILNVGSIAAFQPGPNFAVYAASKAYVMQFTEALNFELRDTGVCATLLSPGVTKTGFISRANMGAAANAKSGLMTAKAVALAGYKAMMKGKLNTIPGWKNQILALGSKTMPSREILLQITARILRDTKEPYKKLENAA
jgi:short-subunit dehydrogenase